MANKKEFEGYYFELMDRCHVQMCMISDHLVDNPKITKKMKKKLEKAQGLIMDVYQWSSSKFFALQEEK